MLSKEARAQIAREYEAGVKVSVIAAEFGIADTSPMRIAESLGVKRRGRKQLDRLQEFELASMYLNTKLTLKEIAARFDVSEVTVWNVLKRSGVKPDRMEKLLRQNVIDL